MITQNDIAVGLLRVGIAYLYLYAGYMNSKDKPAIQWTVDNTAVLFRNTAWKDDRRLIKFFAIAGISAMYIGSIAVLVGIEARLGALFLIAFTGGGTVIHNRLKVDAQAIATGNAGNPQLSGIAWSAFSAHLANVLKNVCLIFVLLFIIIYGAGRMEVSDVIAQFFTSKI